MIRSKRSRGMTLIEMLVSVMLLILLMTILVTIFASATGSIQEQRIIASIDQEQRRIDAVIRLDLSGSTAIMTPPNDPSTNTGYFEYAENALCDAQGEDSDDTLRFTVKAPEGKPFMGRMWVPRTVPITDPGYAPGGARSFTLNPVAVTSTHAEVIYFLRNGNLYRRVLLVNPDFEGKLGVGNYPSDPAVPPDGQPPNIPPVRTGPTVIGFRTDQFRPLNMFGLNATVVLGGYPFVGWAGLNDISARPSAYSASTGSDAYRPRVNTLGDLTDRHHRAFNPQFASDFMTVNPDGTFTQAPDGIPDDLNSDGIPDYQPVLYAGIYSAGNGLLSNSSYGCDPSLPDNSLVYEHFGPSQRPVGLTDDLAGFPYIYPNAYSQPDPATASWGWIHSPDPTITPGPISGRPFHGTYLDPPYNHNPLDLGDSLPVQDPSANPLIRQTWWGFPTWRETASAAWLSAIKRLNDPPGAPYSGARPPGLLPADDPIYSQAPGLSWSRRRNNPDGLFLPPQDPSFFPFSDGRGGNYFYMPPQAVWEEDLLATNVRSFDVKALDPNAAMVVNGSLLQLPVDYYDLGYANLYGPGANGLSASVATPPALLGSFGHEGRMPPLVEDYRSDVNHPDLRPNIGDSNPGVIRMRRVWDSWSTTYTNAPSLPVDPNAGPLANRPPVFPSYPAPYPAALRGIQIRIRITDAEGKRAKNITIRHDFTDKL